MKSLILSAATLLVASGGLGAEEVKETKFDKVMAKYERSGETKRCVNPSRLGESQILDDTHILFRLSPKKAYLNTLPRKCQSLKFYQAITYTVRGGQLCASDMFQVLDQNLRPGMSCSLGKFEKIKKISADKSDDADDAVGR